MTRVERLCAKYGKHLCVRESHDKQVAVFVVAETDDAGVERAVWGAGLTEDEAVEETERLFEEFGVAVADVSPEDAYLAVARTLPSDVLKRVLLERGDWNIEVKT